MRPSSYSIVFFDKSSDPPARSGHRSPRRRLAYAPAPFVAHLAHIDTAILSSEYAEIFLRDRVEPAQILVGINFRLSPIWFNVFDLLPELAEKKENKGIGLQIGNNMETVRLQLQLFLFDNPS